MIESDWMWLRVIECDREWLRVIECDREWLRVIECDWEWLSVIKSVQPILLYSVHVITLPMWTVCNWWVAIILYQNYLILQDLSLS